MEKRIKKYRSPLVISTCFALAFLNDSLYTRSVNRSNKINVIFRRIKVTDVFIFFSSSSSFLEARHEICIRNDIQTGLILAREDKEENETLNISRGWEIASAF